MTRVSPSIAERCRIFSSGNQENTPDGCRRTFYQETGIPTLSGIPVPVNYSRKGTLINGNGAALPMTSKEKLESAMRMSKENEILRIQRKLTSRWVTGPDFTMTNNNHVLMKNQSMINISNPISDGNTNIIRENKQSLEVATMNFSAEDFTTTADETDDCSKVCGSLNF